MFLLFNLKYKYHNDYDVAMKHLDEKYGCLKVDCEIFHPNLLRNDKYIEFYQINSSEFYN